jgi:F-box and WD-40 domain protein CDC4
VRPAFHNPLLRAASGRRKRDHSDDSPPIPSIKEAAELASLHRRSKKPRITVHEDKGDDVTNIEELIPATPDTDLGPAENSKTSKAKMGPSLRVHHKSTSQQASRTHAPPRWQLQESSAGPSSSRPGSSEPREQSPERLLPTSVLDGPGAAATPPIAESDLEPAGPFADDESFSSARLTPLDIGSAQDASLPSPSLSPITAAANAQLSTSGADGDYDPNDVSRLDLSQAEMGDFPLFPSGSRHLDLPDSREVVSPNPQLLTPTIMGIPSMLNSFDALPEQMKSYVMYQLLRRCPKPTLHFVADVVNPALKRDLKS